MLCIMNTSHHDRLTKVTFSGNRKGFFYIASGLRDSDVSGVMLQRRERSGRVRTWCPGPESNRYGPFGPRDFKSRASASFATRANWRFHWLAYHQPQRGRGPALSLPKGRPRHNSSAFNRRSCGPSGGSGACPAPPGREHPHRRRRRWRARGRACACRESP